MSTVAQAVAAISNHTGTSIGHVRHVARRLQDAGYLPLAIGTSVPSVSVEHVVNMLIALLSGAQLKSCAAAVSTYSRLCPQGVDFQVMPAASRPMLRVCRDTFEHALHVLISGTEDERAHVSRLQFDVVQTWPEIRITDPKSGAVLSFVKSGALPTHWQRDTVRRSTTITGRALERICRDLTLTR